MSQTAVTVSTEEGSALLQGHLCTFIDALKAQGYAKTTWRRKRVFGTAFARWVDRGDLRISALDETCLSTYLGPPPHRSNERATLEQLLEHLRCCGVVPRRPVPEPSSADLLLQRYVDHVRRVRGLAERSIAVYSPLVRAFITARELGSRNEIGAALDASVVRRFLLGRARGRSGSYTKLLAAAVRSFLRFLFFHGDTASDLSAAVPPIRRWDATPVPAFLSPEDVERVLATPDRSTARGRRAHAILLLLARLGLRAGEVAGLELDDVHWDQGELVVRGKGGLRDRLPLSQEVGDALALYLRRDRGQSASRRVFLSGCAPRAGLSGPTAVCLVARKALASAGLRPKGRVGAHIFRHSLATQMIRSGASLSEISQALRHRCLNTTQIYTKVDYETLRAVARPWPVTGGRR